MRPLRLARKLLHEAWIRAALGSPTPWDAAGTRRTAWHPSEGIPSWWGKQPGSREPQALPAPLDRVPAMRILPSRYGLAFISIIFISGLTPFSGVGIIGKMNPLALAWTVLAWTAIAVVLARTQEHLKGVRLMRTQAAPVFAGQPAEVLFTFDSTRGTKRGLFVEPMMDGDLAARLAIEEGRPSTVSFRIPTHRRGVHALGPLRVHTSQPMGVAHAIGFLWPKGTLVVYPAPESVAPALPRDTQASRSQQATPGTMPSPGSDEDLLRPYRVGDSARHIRWKASARHRSLLVRDAPPQPPGAVALRWSDVQGLGREAALSRLARWVLMADAEHGPYLLDLEGQGPSIGPSVGPAHRQACLTALAEVAP